MIDVKLNEKKTLEMFKVQNERFINLFILCVIWPLNTTLGHGDPRGTKNMWYL